MKRERELFRWQGFAVDVPAVLPANVKLEPLTIRAMVTRISSVTTTITRKQIKKRKKR